jgi:hypothetical protein
LNLFKSESFAGVIREFRYFFPIPHWHFWNRGFRLTGLYEIHGDFADAQGLKWYVGPGAHVGFYDYYDNHNNHIDGTYIGIDGVLGLDYKFNGARINISIDWQPAFEFGYLGFTL